MRARRRGRERGEAGVSTIEVVIVAPVLILFVITMVGLGLYAQNVAQVQGAAQDAARMASLQRTSGAAQQYAAQIAAADLGGTCNSSPGAQPAVQPPLESSTGTVGAGAQAGAVDLLQVTVVCQVTEFGYSYTITESSYAPVDNYRGGQP
ncbi:MAG TPA: TadE/TadG family type IV pilus assembly protein [Actinospica sp.]|nr:TadE/TadG family type IV pilus assembly protein [Actinospica sp.]